MQILASPLYIWRLWNLSGCPDVVDYRAHFATESIFPNEGTNPSSTTVKHPENKQTKNTLHNFLNIFSPSVKLPWPVTPSDAVKEKAVLSPISNFSLWLPFFHDRVTDGNVPNGESFTKRSIHSLHLYWVQSIHTFLLARSWLDLSDVENWTR